MTRRLLIVSCDGEERLLLLGEGQFVSPKATTTRARA